MVAPILTTERLTLRGFRADDFDRCLRMWSDPTVTRYIGGRPTTEAETWSRLQRYTGMWSLLGFGYWAVEEDATGRYIGDVGFGDHRRVMQPAISGLPEIGWVLAPEAHGRGFATESVRAALAWSDAHLPLHPTTVCIIDPDNHASIRVAQKTGFGEAQDAVYNGNPTLLFARPSRAIV